MLPKRSTEHHVTNSHLIQPDSDQRRLEYTREDLHYVFHHPRLLKELKNLATRHLCIENVLFIERTTALNCNCIEIPLTNDDTAAHRLSGTQSINPICAQSSLAPVCRSILRDFIGKESPLEVNIPSTVTKQILQEIKLADIPRTIYDRAAQEVFNNIFYDLYPKMVSLELCRPCGQSSVHSTRLLNEPSGGPT